MPSSPRAVPPPPPGNAEGSPIILRHELQLLLEDTAKQFVLDVYWHQQKVRRWWCLRILEWRCHG